MRKERLHGARRKFVRMGMRRMGIEGKYFYLQVSYLQALSLKANGFLPGGIV